LRASLASATSLLALLLMEGHEAKAAPIVTTTTTPINFGDILVDQASAVTAGVWTISGQTKNDVLSISPASSPFAGAGSSTTLGNTNTTTHSTSYSFSPSARGTISETITGSDITRTSTSASLTITGNGVAPIESSVGSGFVLVGSGGPVTLTISNVGDGNLSGKGTLSNLRGTVGSSASVFVGSGGTISLGDPTQTTTATSATFNYTYTPTISGQSTVGNIVTKLANGSVDGKNSATTITTTLSATGVAPVQSVSNTGTTFVRVGTSGTSTVSVSNIGNAYLAGTGTSFNVNGSVTSVSLGTKVTANGGNPATISQSSSAAGPGTTTLGYTYTPVSRGASVASTVTIAFSNANSNLQNTKQTVSSVFTDQGVGPVFGSAKSTAGSGVTTPITMAATGTNGSVGPVGATISFGSIGFKQSQTIFLELQNLTTDSLAAASLTDLTIDKFSISGSSAFAPPTITAGTVIHEGDTLIVPLTVVGAAGFGTLNSTLTIFTDESVALGGSGDTFTYALTAIDVPEPTSLAVLGAGLAGLASFRRRRQAAE
jgi:hypothetical protein